MHKFIQRTQQFILKQYLLVLIFSSLLIDAVFNFKIVTEILRNPLNGTYGEDTVLLHYFAESAYQKILHGHNPFLFNNGILYPFGTATVLGETGIIHSFYFLFLRPFLHPYASLLAIVFINLFLCQLAMYALLRYFKIGRFLSFLFANVYAFAPFVSVRIQYHYNYVYHFFFAAITLLILLILNSPHKGKKIIFAILLGILAGLLFYNTLYYVVMYLLFLVLFLFFYFFIQKNYINTSFILFRKNFLYFLIAIGAFFLIISPFLIELGHVLQVSEIKKTEGWGGAVEFSANALDLFIPSEFNPFLGARLQHVIPGKQPIEQIIYPGFLVLLGVLGFVLYHKKNQYHPLVLTFISFFLLSMGPFLHVYRYWNVHITDTILGVIPLPYILFKKIPLLSMMRAPVRFSVMISFTGVLIAATFFQHFLKRYSLAKMILYPLFLLIFFVDQYYIPRVQPEHIATPAKSYAIIADDPSDAVVMEIPYVIQDGFFYWGKVFHAYPMIGQLAHGKKIIGGYLARVDEYKFQYYMQDPLLSYFGYVADANRQEQKLPFKKPSYGEMKKSADFLNIKYILVREDLPFYKSVDADLKKLGYIKKISHDDGMSLYVGNPQLKDSKKFDLSSSFSRNVYGNWSYPEKTHRWIDGRTAGVFIKSTTTTPVTISFHVVSYKVPRKMSIYVNKKLTQVVIIPTVPTAVSFSSGKITKGLNTIDFVVAPVRLKRLPGEDSRNLSVAFSDFMIQ